MELFNDSFTKSTTGFYKGSHTQLDGDMKKKVIFKDPDDDDILADLLSDEEASIKDEEKKTISSSKTSLMEDLFKIKSPIPSTTSIKSSIEMDSKFNFEQAETNELSVHKSNSYLASKRNLAIPGNESSKENSTQKLRNVPRNEEDTLTSLIDKSDVVDKRRRSSLIENLFEDKAHSSNTLDFATKNVKKVESENTIPIAAQAVKSNPTDQSTKFSVRESRKGRRNTKIINDPLGLLSSNILSNQNVEQVAGETIVSKDFLQNTKMQKDLPEWLSGAKKLEDKEEEKLEDTAKTDNISVPKQNIDIHTKEVLDLKATTGLKAASIFPQHISMLFGTQLNQQNALMNIHQQEHELRTAALLSQQNDQLNKVSSAQHTLLHEQEEQFNALLKLQFERQGVLEKQIQIQQERINQYIQALMTQSNPMTEHTVLCNSCKTVSNGTEKEMYQQEKDELENKIKNLQSENSKLESILSTIREKHSGELTLQAEFYERQILFLKEVITKLEERVKHEIECLENDYVTKFEKLRDEKQQMENQYKEEIHNLKNEHSQHIEGICKLHSENVQLLQKEYSNIIENISQARQVEDKMIQTITGQKVDIEDMLQKASFVISNIQEKQKDLETKRIEMLEFQESNLKIHEADIKAQQAEVKRQNDILEDDRKKFIETTESLHIRLTQLINELQKQSTLCNQAQETVKKKEAYLLQERGLFEEKMKWEREYMQMLKESWAREQEKQVQLLANEKKALTTEKAQLDILSKLKTTTAEIKKVEVEAIIKSAQEATASATKEKLKWQEKINELNVQQQVLQDKERLLILRAKELENLMKTALTKKEEGIQALRNAKHLESQSKEKFNQLQVQIQALMERERGVAMEWHNVTKEGMISLAYEAEELDKDINILHNFQNNMQSKSEITSERMNIVDPNLILLKLDLNDEFTAINKYR